MTEKTSKTGVTGKTVETKKKRPSKSQRIHTRRVKSEARKTSTT